MYNVIFTEDYVVGPNNLGGENEVQFETKDEVKSLINAITVASGKPTLTEGILCWHNHNRTLTASIYYNNKPLSGYSFLSDSEL